MMVSLRRCHGIDGLVWYVVIRTPGRDTTVYILDGMDKASVFIFQTSGTEKRYGQGPKILESDDLIRETCLGTLGCYGHLDL